MLRGRAKHLCAHEQAASMLSINSEQAPILADNPTAALILEGHLSNGETAAAALINLVNRQPHRRNLRIGEDHGQRRAAKPGSHIRV